MADNELKIKVLVDKVSVEEVKAENRKLIAQMKADAEKSIKELDTQGKLQLAQENNLSKERRQRWKADADYKKKLAEIEYKEYVRQENLKMKEAERVAKDIANSQKRESDLAVRVRQRQLEQAFRTSPVMTGKSTFFGDINSQAYFKAQIKGYTDLRNSIAQTNPKWAEYDAKVKQAQVSLSAFNGVKRMSIFQMAEFGENITTITVGIGLAVVAMQRFAAQAWQMAQSGSELMVLRNYFEEISGGAEQAALDLQLLNKAASGNLNEKELYAYANRMREVGLSTKETAQVLDIAERTSDRAKVTFDEAQSKLFKWIETGKGRGFEQMGLDIASLNSKTEEYISTTGKKIETIDADELSTYRLKAAVDLYGSSIDEINRKAPELDDKIAGATKKLDNMKDSLGVLLAQGLEPAIDTFGVFASVLSGTSGAAKELDDQIRKFSGGMVKYADMVNVLMNPLSTLISLLTDRLPKAIGKATTGLDALYKALAVSTPNNFMSGAFDMIGGLIGKVRELLSWMGKIPGVEIKGGDVQGPEQSTGDNIQYKSGDFYTREGEYKTGWGDFYSQTFSSSSKGSSRGGSGKDEDPLQKLINETSTALRLAEVERRITREMYQDAIRTLTAKIDSNLEEEKRLSLLEEIEKYEKKVWEYRKDITGIKSLDNVSLTDKSPMRNLRSFTGGGSFIRSNDMEVLIQNTVLPFSEAFYNLGNEVKGIFTDMTDVLGLESDSFVAKLVNGFDTVLKIVQMITSTFGVIDSVKSLISLGASFIPGGGAIAAVGGISGGGGMPMPMIQQSVRRPVINVVVQSEVERTKAVTFFDNYYDAFQNSRRSSTF